RRYQSCRLDQRHSSAGSSHTDTDCYPPLEAQRVLADPALGGGVVVSRAVALQARLDIELAGGPLVAVGRAGAGLGGQLAEPVVLQGVDQRARGVGQVAGAAELVLQIPGGGARGDLRDQGVRAVAEDVPGDDGAGPGVIDPGVAVLVVCEL